MSKCFNTKKLISDVENRQDFIDTLVEAELEVMYPGYNNLNESIEKEKT